MFEKSTLGHHAYEEDHKTNEGLANWTSTTYRKYKESAHMSLISQPSLDISPIRTTIIAAEVATLLLRPVEINCGNCAFVLVPYTKFFACIREMLVRILTCTLYNVRFLWDFFLNATNAGIITVKRPQLTVSEYFPLHYSPIIARFEPVHSEILIASQNK
jgi:hypothetical protein